MMDRMITEAMHNDDAALAVVLYLSDHARAALFAEVEDRRAVHFEMTGEELTVIGFVAAFVRYARQCGEVTVGDVVRDVLWELRASL